ncbi:MAG: hypothetical protein WKG07_47360 [Hymenobacter sp.]
MLLSALTVALTGCGSDKTAETTATTTMTATTNPADSMAAMSSDSARMAKPGGVMVDGVAMTADREHRAKCRWRPPA